jgi:hypothetical protein
MRAVLLATAVVLLAGCPQTDFLNAPPLTQLYFPTALVHVDVPNREEGVLFVTNSNHDKRFASGSIMALELDALGLPPLGTPVPASGAAQLADLKVDETRSVQVATFGAQLDSLRLSADRLRLFLPTRSEGMRLYRVEASFAADGTPTLACLGETPVDQPRNCVTTGVSLTPKALEQTPSGVPRAPHPYGVSVATRPCVADAECGDGRSCAAGRCLDTDGAPFADVFVGHLTQADSPVLTNTNLRAYLVRVDSDAFTVAAENFIELGPGATNGVVANDGWVFTSGRVVSPAPNLLRSVSRAGGVYSSGLEYSYRVSDSRGVALSSDGKRLYLVGRVPDALLVVSVEDPTVPRFVRGVVLPDAPNEVRVISRPGRGDLVVVTSTSTGSIAFYDDDVGDLVGGVTGLGTQPFGLAVDHRGTAARLYVSNFGDGRVAVVDVPDLSRPQDARLVAHLGSQQTCLTRGPTSPACLALGGVQ